MCQALKLVVAGRYDQGWVQSAVDRDYNPSNQQVVPRLKFVARLDRFIQEKLFGDYDPPNQRSNFYKIHSAIERLSRKFHDLNSTSRINFYFRS